ncbi:LamG-like jellyroll fold domain-containing protein [Streptomyces prunicolor]|uniref:LamG-like jellyroll fold domain-containing protein n=1 Tax=Streptomyces prunicolor TaxID=67348 RepID=A0ABU4FJ97_9ACTN|nr:LamG-like jellyroll fold domain-containing protein [Streptomyces prunicolor]MDV7220619.1 LamG-like jellyroll fold domain-containing protein [Streptomyces prunicolor]
MALLAEMGWGGLIQAPATITWTDISTYVDTVTGVTITRGASDELSETQPGTASLRLDNQDGRFTPGNSASPYYPYVRRNAPIRISAAVMPTVSGSAPYPLAMLGDAFDDGRVNSTLWVTNTGGAGVETSEARLRITLAPGVDTNFTSSRQWKLQGSKLTAKLAAVPALNGSSNCAASMWVLAVTSGTRIGWRYDAGTGVLAAMSQVGSTDATPTNLTYSAIDHAWVRVRESSGTVYWETSGDGYAWTTRRTLATPAWVTTDTVAVDFPTTRTGGTSGYIEWALVGAEIRPRFYGVVNEFPVDWEGLSSHVTISCTDLFKRLNRLPTLRSMLTEEIANFLPDAYYPLTEPDDSTSAGDVSGNGLPSMAITQISTGGTLTMGTDTGPDATGDSTPTFTPSTATAGLYLAVDLGAAVQQALTNNEFSVEGWFKTTTTGRAILGLYSADLQCVQVVSLSASGALQIEWTASGSSTLTVTTVDGTSGLADGKWHHFQWTQSLSGSVSVDGVGVDASVPVTDGFDQRFLHIGGYRGTRLWSGSLAHVALYARPSIGSVLTTHYASGMTGNAGEDADTRIARFCEYVGLVDLIVQGSTFDPIASQGPGGTGAVARMREVESTESAKLFAARDQYLMTFQSRDLRYNPSPAGESFTIAYADLETKSVGLADDDQKLTNSLEASRPGGATQKVTAPASILAFGVYDPGALSILKTSDNSVLDAAYWRVSRYANPGPELREVPIEAYTMSNYLAILAADISSYFSVTSMPSQAPFSSVRVTVEGYTETIKERSHLIQFHTSTTNGDSVWVLDDTTYSVLDSTTRLAY